MELDPQYESVLGRAYIRAEALQTQAAVAQKALEREEEFEDMEIRKEFELGHKIYANAMDDAEDLVNMDRGSFTPVDYRMGEDYRINRKKFEQVWNQDIEQAIVEDQDFEQAHIACCNSGDEEVFPNEIHRKLQTSISDYEELVDRAIDEYDIDIERLRDLPDTVHDAEIIG